MKLTGQGAAGRFYQYLLEASAFRNKKRHAGSMLWEQKALKAPYQS